ncbi:MAG: cytochrome b N-terminal domain-containing protein [Betaproteobacteria bacterium]|nr:cytochrome b N-terminal domain-containing protein [Betaproteobacteria bacterium]
MATPCLRSRADRVIDAAIARAFAAPYNPWRQLGALTSLALAITVASGIVAYALYDTSISGAYQSGLRLQNDPSYFGVLLRGLHRYGADAFMLLMILHLLREFLRSHYRGPRWYSWLSGVPLIWLGWLAGLTGLWLLWDSRALHSVMATAEWLQALPLVDEGLVRNFLASGALNDRFFSLVMFLHIGVPLFLIGGLWAHLQRIHLPAVWPRRAAGVGLLLTLGVVSLLAPAQSLGMADPHFVPKAISLDWFFQLPHVLTDSLSGAGTWAVAGGLTLLCASLPWLDRGRRKPAPARVELIHCNGCSRCAADCPFGAIRMVPRTDGGMHAQQAAVDDELCVACGICVGACPSSTPFRRIEDLVSGIELPEQPIGRLRQTLREVLKSRAPGSMVLVCRCRHSPGGSQAPDPSMLSIEVECLGMLPPSFLDFALRQGLAGAVLAGCEGGNCEFRLGDRWTLDRIAGRRAPRLRRNVARERIISLARQDDEASIRNAVDELLRHPMHDQPGDAR